MSLGWFIFHWVFLLSCILPIKAERMVGLTFLPTLKLGTPFTFAVARRTKLFTSFLCEIDYL